MHAPQLTSEAIFAYVEVCVQCEAQCQQEAYRKQNDKDSTRSRSGANSGHPRNAAVWLKNKVRDAMFDKRKLGKLESCIGKCYRNGNYQLRH